MSSLEGAEGGKEGAEEKFYYHRDTEGTEFRRNPNFRKSDTIRFRFFKSETHPFPFSELRVLCVSVVINSPSVFSSGPLCALTPPRLGRNFPGFFRYWSLP